MLEDTQLPGNVPSKFGDYTRILKLTRKPTREEFLIIAKVAGAGILLIGLIGFLVYLALTLIPRGIS